MRYLAALILPLYLFLFAGATSNHAHAENFALPPPQQGKHLKDCLAKLDKQGGGWCEIRLPGEHPSMSSVWPILDAKTHMVVGSRAVLGAWSGAAFDEENLLLYFSGGGHGDYGGNEVYEFDLNTGRWARLTDPSPLDFVFLSIQGAEQEPSRYCWIPDLRKVPGSVHTYDGLQFSRKTKTIFMAMHGAANGACFWDEEKRFENDPRVLHHGRAAGAALYEFNPSRAEERNGLQPLSWRRYGLAEGTGGIGLPRSVELPDGSLLFGSRVTFIPFDPTTGTWGELLWSEADYGDGISVYHPSGKVVSLHRVALLVRSLDSRALEVVRAPPSLHRMSLAVGKDAVLFSWDGGVRLLSIDLNAPEAERKWRVYDWSDAGPSEHFGRVYSKWQYVSEHDVFVGIATYKTGVWVYKHPAKMPGIELAKTDPQQLINEAKPGAVVTIPAGIYGQGLFINKSLTVRLKDARLWGTGPKGIINVQCDGCAVVLEDFHGEGQAAGCTWGNCAGVKAEGVGFKLTVKRAHIDRTVNGILTDNRGGQLVVEDSLIENTAVEQGAGSLGHGLYAGRIDSLVLRRSTIRNINNDGHILKSRAKETILEGAQLIGAKGFHSRSIDAPCGGKMQITESLIQHGENTDNPEVIAIGTEPQNCGDRLDPTSVSISKSWIIIDRDRSDDERAKTYGKNFLFRWRAPMSSVELKNNHIVNMERWATKNEEGTELPVPDQSAANEMCASRSACGLAPDQLPDL